MKNLVLAVVIVLGFSSVSFGQTPVTAFSTASAILVTPLSIENTANMDFGTVAATSADGTIVLGNDGGLLANDGARIIMSSTGVSAKFTIAGEPDAAISITNTANDADVVLTSGANTLHVSSFSPINTDATAIGNDGTVLITVGATLTIPANSAAGTYTNDEAYTVTVNYN